jgi:hypothetical protein
MTIAQNDKSDDRTIFMIAVCLALMSSCGSPTPPSPLPPPVTAPPPYDVITVNTAPGLSGLASNADGTLFAVAERQRSVYQIKLGTPPDVQEIKLLGVPEGIDLEGIAWLGSNHFAVATEGKDVATAGVLWLDLDGTQMTVVKSLDLPSSALGVKLEKNHGAEGICGDDQGVVVAIEATKDVGHKRWAPIVRVRGDELVVSYIRLQSKRGKIASLDCNNSNPGERVWAIERHYETSMIESFVMPDAATDIVSKVAIDLSAAVNGTKNLEGIVHRADGTTILVVDNQSKTISGPSELLVLKNALNAN